MIYTSLRLLLAGCLLGLGTTGALANDDDTATQTPAVAPTTDADSKPATERTRPERGPRGNRDGSERRSPEDQRQRPDNAPRQRPEGGRRASLKVNENLLNDLVMLQNGELTPLDKSTVENIKFYAVLFASKDSRDGSRVTSDLASAYKRLKDKHSDFEVIFISTDKDAKDFESFVKGQKMPWPILNYEKAKSMSGSHGGRGMAGARLLMVDADGKLLAPDPSAGRDGASPQAVIKEIPKILSKAK